MWVWPDKGGILKYQTADLAAKIKYTVRFGGYLHLVKVFAFYFQ